MAIWSALLDSDSISLLQVCHDLFSRVLKVFPSPAARTRSRRDSAFATLSRQTTGEVQGLERDDKPDAKSFYMISASCGQKSWTRKQARKHSLFPRVSSSFPVLVIQSVKSFSLQVVERGFLLLDLISPTCTTNTTCAYEASGTFYFYPVASGGELNFYKHNGLGLVDTFLERVSWMIVVLDFSPLIYSFAVFASFDLLWVLSGLRWNPPALKGPNDLCRFQKHPATLAILNTTSRTVPVTPGDSPSCLLPFEAFVSHANFLRFSSNSSFPQFLFVIDTSIQLNLSTSLGKIKLADTTSEQSLSLTGVMT
eukprot:750545-Hanusia_phi.AAC.1